MAESRQHACGAAEQDHDIGVSHTDEFHDVRDGRQVVPPLAQVPDDRRIMADLAAQKADQVNRCNTYQSISQPLSNDRLLEFIQK